MGSRHYCEASRLRGAVFNFDDAPLYLKSDFDDAPLASVPEFFIMVNVVLDSSAPGGVYEGYEAYSSTLSVSTVWMGIIAVLVLANVLTLVCIGCSKPAVA